MFDNWNIVQLHETLAVVRRRKMRDMADQADAVAMAISGTFGSDQGRAAFRETMKKLRG